MSPEREYTLWRLLIGIIRNTDMLLSESEGRLLPAQREDLVEIHVANLKLARILNQVMKGEWEGDSMIHDLRSPLNIIIGYSEILIDDHNEELNPAQRSFLRAIYDDGLTVSNTLGELFN
ncbi:MAG: hypothetical protein H7Y09_09565 [Chitinophagaceae bacterium]|nr:hypothetical protein [Anaerolineae bacterium]